MSQWVQKPKGCQNNRQTLYYNRSTFGANSSEHLKLAPRFPALGGATKSRCFRSSQCSKRAKIGLWTPKPSRLLTWTSSPPSIAPPPTVVLFQCSSTSSYSAFWWVTPHQFCVVFLPDCSKKNAFLLWKVLLKNASLWRNACADWRQKLIKYRP